MCVEFSGVCCVWGGGVARLYYVRNSSKVRMIVMLLFWIWGRVVTLYMYSLLRYVWFYV